MSLFKKSEEEKQEEQKIKEFQEKCNFLTKSGICRLQGLRVEVDCPFEKCIFMKRLNDKQ